MHATKNIVAAVRAPSSAGKVIASPPVRGKLTVATVVGSCSTEIDATYVDLSVALDPAAIPMADVMEYRTFVDGKPWLPVRAIYETALPDRSWQGHGKERVFSYCPKSNAQDDRPEFALTPGPRGASYAVAKAAEDTLVRAIAREVADRARSNLRASR